MSRPVTAGLVALAALACVGCEPRPPEHVPDLEPPPETEIVGELPDALLVRFRTVAGTVLKREGWEIEILQMGGEVRVRGAVRTEGASAPIFRTMTDAEFANFWQWLSGFPLDRHRVEVDAASPQEGWRKSCKVDVVLGPDRRLIAENEWTRRLVSPAWMQQFEDRLHLMALDYAEQALSQPPEPTENAEETDEEMQRALDALRDPDD